MAPCTLLALKMLAQKALACQVLTSEKDIGHPKTLLRKIPIYVPACLDIMNFCGHYHPLWDCQFAWKHIYGITSHHSECLFQEHQNWGEIHLRILNYQILF